MKNDPEKQKDGTEGSGGGTFLLAIGALLALIVLIGFLTR